MNIFVLILLWQHILYLCTLFLVQGGLPARETTYTNAGYAATTILIRKVHILTRDFSSELYVLPDDDKQYVIETRRSSESVLKK